VRISVDFGIGKGLANLPALRQVGFTANRRLLGVQKISHDPAAGATAITAITAPVITPAGTRIPACASPTNASRPCCRPYAPSGCCPTASPTAISAPTSRRCSAGTSRT
jgi:hypothetical protein